MFVFCDAVRRDLCVAVLFLVFAFVGLARAQNTSDFPLSHEDAWEISVRASEIGMIKEGGALLSTAAIGYGLVLTDPLGKDLLRGTLEYTIEGLPAIIMTRPTLIYGAGVAPFGFKWNFLANPRHRPYAEAVFGGVQSHSNVPPGNSSVNFTINAGVGLTLLTRGNETLTAGFDYSHLSCGFLCSRNPSLNGVAIVIEYHWLKPK